MGYPPKGSYAWYDDDDSLEEQLPTDPGMAGLPEHWRYYEWKIAAILFAILWVLETITSGLSLTALTNINLFAKDVWSLLLVLTVCAGLFHFWIRRRPSVGFSLCVVIAGSALLRHTL